MDDGRGQQVSEEDYWSLQRDYTDATEQFAAMNEVLTALGRSSSDPDAVFDTIIASVRRLCRCEGAAIFLIEDGQFALSSSDGFSDEYVTHVAEHPFQLDRASLLGRVTQDREIHQIPDVLTDPEYGRQDVQRIVQFHTSLAAPMLLDDEVVGAFSLVRTAVDPFDDREQALVGAFAAQAAVVVRNVHLVRELESRGRELSRKVDQLEALSEVGGLVSSSLVLDEVLSNIIMNAVRFSGCDGGSIMEYVEDERRFAVRSAYASSPELLAKLRTIRVDLESTLVGRSAMEGHPIAVADLATVELDPHLQLLYDDGWRSIIAVPVLHGERIIGALVVRRRTTGEFSAETVEFLETFAGQSALAVWNAQLFRELETKSAELQVVSQHKSEFLASMSHELRTPLNAVIGFSEVLLERMFGELNDRQDEYLRDILSSGKHLLNLLNDILDLSKVEAGRMELEPSTFSLRGAIEYTMSMVRERAAGHGIDVALEIDPELDTIESDELRFKQVLLNLLSNAVKFTPDGGHVQVAAHRRGGEIAVTVADDGIGIPPEDRERIFESFQQGRRGAQSEEGTGLGLTLCRRIVALLGGSMWLETELGVGSTFGFTVPLDAAAAQAATRPGAEAGLPVVVVVEDDRASLDLMTAYLEGLGVRVALARDGKEGLELIRTLSPAAVVLDIRLPGLDGWEVLSRVRADDVTRAVPVIVVSILDEKHRGMSMGAAEYLVKPVARDALVGALHRVGALPSATPDADRDPVAPQGVV
ncbi:GAF domain-containing protein [Microbacterium sp. cf046]|uniref:hybrid sensor histidine kinase/response regulator n=1 Tax=Microbacterium sp. cf046 TaxID=1761803 RepID=UPI0008F30FDE|nr:ATP-binding protein [Microbacterium sp. cf046]SFR92861.1 GAF domain-containing protein [Microbacterium sp. cf046]